MKVFTFGMDSTFFQNSDRKGINAVAGIYSDEPNRELSGLDQEYDLAIIRVNVSNDSGGRDRMFGGAQPDELDFLAFSDMAKSNSWVISPSLEDIQEVMEKVGPEKTILSINFRQPYVLDQGSGILNAGAILGTFGVSDAALMDIITGKFNPVGKLPFALANNPEIIKTQDPDAPGYPEKDTLFPFGFGLNY